LGELKLLCAERSGDKLTAARRTKGEMYRVMVSQLNVYAFC